MNFPRSVLRYTQGFLVTGMVWLNISCASETPATRYILDSPDKTVGMEVTYREGSPEYFHPVAVNPEFLDQFLKLIEVQPSSLLDRLTGSSATIQKAFSDEQLEVLTGPLSKALEQSTSLETVTFFWATPRGNGIWEITSGGMFLHDNNLHLVLPNFRHTVPATTPPQQLKEHPLTPLGEPLHSLKPIDPVKQLSPSLATEFWAPQAPHFVVSLQALAKEPTPLGSSQGPTSNPPKEIRESIRHRLKNLEELRKEGLLTEHEYQLKRQEILEEL